ncbi:DNA-binding response regulator [Actinomadura sp. NBRC 104412]|uniref:response regulator n=1 Tax=Actinomadura sp. NBRC 104412 TaxID=3032203 RepID=UPI0024A31E2A|nr:response regulator transcription factor [Actinomadura sp. NBRC 104412]GLZ06496.1 DNA-binding response regulator [Actinomadura sp. NBRC 104412]
MHARDKSRQTFSQGRPGPAIRVLIADGEPAGRRALRRSLAPANDIEVVGEAADGGEAVEAARRLRPDVVLMDLSMPQMGGMAAIRRILDAPDTPSAVIALSPDSGDDHLFEALQSGVSGFLLKDGDPTVLIEAIRRTHRGHGLLDPLVTRRVIERLAVLSPLPPSPELRSLTAREDDVLALLAQGHSNRAIASILKIGEGTVKIHVNRVLAKLNLHSRVQAAIYAIEHGVIMPRHGTVAGRGGEGRRGRGVAESAGLPRAVAS